ncbi:hypothetical protein H0H81_001660 [Sphagnurus paluster]|uniref:Uncharacterized protein n=1 Tax=Sphagnurus paluster TaxID=117069 RepID=A0A9P7K4P6_9AGAR|nr:hypothetical protein H0H81_001660 [Sphagnurus paluster]
MDRKVETPERQVLGHGHASSSPSVPATPPPARTAEAIFEEYYLRSHGKKSVPLAFTHWQDWSWSQLRHPRFMVSSDRTSYDIDDNDSTVAELYINDVESTFNDSISAAVF